MLVLDGSFGEGGGQILRTALSLSMVTGTPFRIEKVRARRAKPGLLRQHLTCVRAAAEISHAKVSGAEIGATALTFEPGPVSGGDYTFAIGSAGSTALVLQTILPALLLADAASRVTISGGTHNPSAPTFDYLDAVVVPLLRRMAADVTVTLDRAGFYPAGGGRIRAAIAPVERLRPLILEDFGDISERRIRADVAAIGYDVAERETARAAHLLSWPVETAAARTVKADGYGNVMSITLGTSKLTEQFTAFGAHNVSAEAVADAAVADVRAYLVARAPVGPHLADQLLLPMALAGSGRFVTSMPTLHTRTNIAVIEKFLPVKIALDQLDSTRWRISMSR